MLWIVVELLLLSLFSREFGAAPVFLFLAAKSIFGIFLFSFLARRGLKSMLNGARSSVMMYVSKPMFYAIGSLLFFIPGFISTFLGLALFSPSVQHFILRKFLAKAEAAQNDGTINLDRSEWQETAEEPLKGGREASQPNDRGAAQNNQEIEILPPVKKTRARTRAKPDAQDTDTQETRTQENSAQEPSAQDTRKLRKDSAP